MKTIITRTIHHFNPIRWTTNSKIDAISLSLDIWISARGIESSNTYISRTNCVYEAEDQEIEELKEIKLDFWIDEFWVYHRNKKDEQWCNTNIYK